MALITPPKVNPIRQIKQKPIQNVVQQVQQPWQPPNQDAGIERNLKAEEQFVKNWQGQGGRLPTANEINKAIYGNENPQFNTPQGTQPQNNQQQVAQQPQNLTQVSGASRSIQNPNGDDLLNIGRLAWDLSGQGQQQQQQYGSSSIDQFGGNRQAFMNMAQEYLKSGDVTNYLLQNAGISQGDQIGRQKIVEQARGLNQALQQATQQHFGGQTAPLTGAGTQQSTSTISQNQPPPATGNQITDEKSLLDYVKNNYGVTASPTGPQSTPQQTIQSIVTDISKSLNLPDYSAQLKDIAKARTDLMNERDTKIFQVNDNPWVSESQRTRQVGKLNDLYEQKIANKNAEFTLLQNNFDSARQQAQFIAGQAINIYQNQQSMDQKNKEFYVDTALKIQEARRQLERDKSAQNKPIELNQGSLLINPLTGQIIARGPKKEEAVPASYQEYQLAKKEGFKGTFNDYQTVDANRKRSITNTTNIIGDSGLTGKQADLFTGVVKQYNTSPLIQASDRTPVLKNAIAEIRKDPSSGPKQLNLVYSYIQALDTYQSAVREGELGLVNSIDSKIGKLSNAVQQIQQGQIVRPEVAKEIASASESLVSTISNAASAKAKSFDSQAKTLGIGEAWDKYKKGFTPSFNAPVDQSTIFHDPKTNKNFIRQANGKYIEQK